MEYGARASLTNFDRSGTAENIRQPDLRLSIYFMPLRTILAVFLS